MGLDNFFLVLAEKKDDNGRDIWLGCNYKGDELPGPLCIGMFTCKNSEDDGDDAAFRGKFYSPLVDALICENGWLYANRTRDEIRSAWDKMKPYYERFKTGEADDEIQDLVRPLHWEYTKEDVMTFLTFFKYYGETVEDETLKLSAWY